MATINNKTKTAHTMVNCLNTISPKRRGTPTVSLIELIKTLLIFSASSLQFSFLDCSVVEHKSALLLYLLHLANSRLGTFAVFGCWHCQQALACVHRLP